MASCIAKFTPFRPLALLQQALAAIDLIVGWFVVSRLGLGGPMGPYAFAEGGSRVFAPAGDLLSFASPPDGRPKESKQRKGDPTVCVPALRFGQPAVLASSGVSLELAALRFAQTIASPDPLAAALLGAYRGDGEPNIQTATRAIAALGPGGASWRLTCLGLFLPTSSGLLPSPFG